MPPFGRSRSCSPGASSSTISPLITSGLRFLAIEVGLPVCCERNDAKPALGRNHFAGRGFYVKAMTSEKPFLHRWPKSSTHQRIYFRKTFTLKDHGLGSPFARTIAKNSPREFGLVRIQCFARDAISHGTTLAQEVLQTAHC